MERQSNPLSSVIDEAIILYEQGKGTEAYKMLDHYDIPYFTLHRIFCYPEKRRQYINDYISGN